MKHPRPEDLIGQLGQVILDKEHAIRLLLTAILADGHVLLEDLPGVGKTTLALALARSLGLDFVRIQMTADTLPGDILGGSFYDPGARAFVFRAGPIFHSLLLVDEINRASPRTQSALMEALAEGQVSVDGVTRTLPRPFLVIATQNPLEFDGVFPLPENQLDRFLLSLSLGYPSRQAEERILNQDALAPPALEALADGPILQDWQAQVKKVFLSAEIRTLLLDIAARSRRDPALRLGISPRGLLALKGAAQAWAMLSGRDHVLPTDLAAVTAPVLGHRLQWRESDKGVEHLAHWVRECWGFEIDSGGR